MDHKNTMLMKNRLNRSHALKRRRHIIAGWAILAFAPLAFSTQAQTLSSDWPSKQITFIVPYAPGGFGDTRMRLVARKLSDKLGQPVVVENKAGAGGTIGTALVAKAKPDGYTIGSGHLAPLAVNPSLLDKLPYNPNTDITAVALVENSPLVLSVSNALPVKDLTSLIDLAKRDPGKLSFGSSGVGGAHHLSGEMFANQAGLKLVHVPYKGGAPAATDLMAGHLNMMFEMGYAALPAIQSGKVKPIAVTSKERIGVLPEVPTMSEAGLPGFESYNWQGVIAPANLPAPILNKLNQTINEILKDPEVADAIKKSGSQAAGGSPKDFAVFIQSEQEKWKKVIQSAGVSVR